MVMKSPKICKNKEVILPKKSKNTCSCLLYGGLMFVFKLLLMLGAFRVCDDISQFVAWLFCFLGGCPHTNPQVLISTSLLLWSTVLGARLGLENARIFQTNGSVQNSKSLSPELKLENFWMDQFSYNWRWPKSLQSPPWMGNSDHITNLISYARKVGFRSLFLTFFHVLWHFMTLNEKLMPFWDFYLSYISPTQQQWQIKVHVGIP